MPDDDKKGADDQASKTRTRRDKDNAKAAAAAESNSKYGSETEKGAKGDATGEETNSEHISPNPTVLQSPTAQ